MPTVLGILGYDRPYIAFGQDILHTPTAETFSVNYLPASGIYQFLKGDYLIQFDGEKVIHAYRFRTDLLMKDDIKMPCPKIHCKPWKTVEVNHPTIHATNELKPTDLPRVSI